ncbi:MAG: ABC transporter ATP-binding protein [Coriobacteriales bacterium]|nr:ABC transporter ATP-binding protein [Coriobacteriales bacterium]
MSTILSTLPHMDAGADPCDLRIKSVSKHYKGFTLDSISLDVPRGSIVGLIGQNGAGKTTLMKAALGTIRIDGGAVELFGQNVADLSDSERIALHKRVGFVGAVTAYPSVMTVSEVATMYGLAFPAFDRAAFECLATRMELLPGSANKKVKDLSRGMGMKLQLACVLASGADLIVLDEPTAGLDPIVREDVLDIVRTWMEDERHSALISSHITTDLEKVADYLVFIEDGRVIMSCERDAIESMGVARLRSAELERVLADGLVGNARVLRHDLSYDLLVFDRIAFQRAYPDFVCDRASIDDVMVLIVKGEVR